MGAGVTATDGVDTGSTAVSVKRAVVAFVSGSAPTSALASGSLRTAFTSV